uniref:Uncharacterized protein n=1 Tax=Leersia perrieri TaxID=77586 RepID=A0A0D9WHE0_9ORYZ
MGEVERGDRPRRGSGPVSPATASRAHDDQPPGSADREPREGEAEEGRERRSGKEGSKERNEGDARAFR